MTALKRYSARTGSVPQAGTVAIRRAVGYIRVSTDMQANEGISLEAQHAAIEQYCALHGLKLVTVCKDVLSGGKDQRPGLQDALRTLEQSGDVLVVLKFDRLSRSIRHFCELYETYFKDGEKELVAIRESIRLDSALGRALINILLVFAQMERELRPVPPKRLGLGGGPRRRKEVRDRSWITWASCRCNSCPLGARVKHFPHLGD